MFQFRRFPTYAYLIQHMLLRLLLVGFPIRISPDLSLFAAPRSFSQLITSFIGSWCQGIPLALFFAWPLNLLCSSFTSSCRSIHFWFLFKFYKNYAGSHFFVSLLAKLLFTLNFVSLLLPFLIVSHSLFVQFSRCICEPFYSLVGQSGLEPPTSRLSVVCSSQLSYWPVFFSLPSSPFLLSKKWWRLAGSNRWPPACKAGALPAELNPHLWLPLL